MRWLNATLFAPVWGRCLLATRSLVYRFWHLFVCMVCRVLSFYRDLKELHKVLKLGVFNQVGCFSVTDSKQSFICNSDSVCLEGNNQKVLLKILKSIFLLSDSLYFIHCTFCIIQYLFQRYIKMSTLNLYYSKLIYYYKPYYGTLKVKINFALAWLWTDKSYSVTQ